MVWGEGVKNVGTWRNEEQAKVQSRFQSETPKEVPEEQEIIVCTSQFSSMHTKVIAL